MSFDRAWLDLREPADHAARNQGLLDMARDHATKVDSPLIVDLGSGTGSTVRAFGLASARWRLIDNDATLLQEARARSGNDIGTYDLDLRDPGSIPLDGARLVTASALIDLVSAAWLDALANRLAAANIGFYAALSYDGDMRWAPADPDDAAVTAAFNRHQIGNKGFGPALGPVSGAYLARAMRQRGFAVSTAPSPWILDRTKADLHRQLLQGIAGAAHEAGCEIARGWLERQSKALDAECSVGHVDVLALPPR